METQEFKALVQEIYIQYRYLFQKYRKDTTSFSRNGISQQWAKNKLEEKER